MFSGRPGVQGRPGPPGVYDPSLWDPSDTGPPGVQGPEGNHYLELFYQSWKETK